jgi:hypothetical protein
MQQRRRRGGVVNFQQDSSRQLGTVGTAGTLEYRHVRSQSTDCMVSLY